MGLSEMIDMFSALLNMIVSRYMWLLSSLNVASVTKELNV